MRLVSASLVVSFFTGAALAQKPPHEFLRTVGGFSNRDLAELDTGDVTITTLDSEENELALLGAVRIQGTVEAFLELYRDIRSFEAELGTASKFSDPPELADLAELDFDHGDIKALEHCKLEDCDLKMGAEALEELRSRIDWDAPNAHDEVVRFVKERIVDYARAYQRGGNAALGVYRNESKPRYVAQEFDRLLARSPYVLQYRPELHAYLLDYPKATLDGASGFLYWSVINFGPKPTLRVNHVTIYPVEDGPNGNTVIASKQLYYSRYFDTGLEIYTLVRDEAHPDSGFYLVALNRYRTDLGGGLTGKIMRLAAEAGTKGAMHDTLEAAQKAIRDR